MNKNLRIMFCKLFVKKIPWSRCFYVQLPSFSARLRACLPRVFMCCSCRHKRMSFTIPKALARHICYVPTIFLVIAILAVPCRALVWATFARNSFSKWRNFRQRSCMGLIFGRNMAQILQFVYTSGVKLWPRGPKVAPADLEIGPHRIF